MRCIRTQAPLPGDASGRAAATQTPPRRGTGSTAATGPRPASPHPDPWDTPYPWDPAPGTHGTPGPEPTGRSITPRGPATPDSCPVNWHSAQRDPAPRSPPGSPHLRRPSRPRRRRPVRFRRLGAESPSSASAGAAGFARVWLVFPRRMAPPSGPRVSSGEAPPAAVPAGQVAGEPRFRPGRVRTAAGPRSPGWSRPARIPSLGRPATWAVSATLQSRRPAREGPGDWRQVAQRSLKPLGGKVEVTSPTVSGTCTD